MSLYLDDTTVKDLSIFDGKERQSIFSLFNSTRTKGGEHYLHQYFVAPFHDLETIKAVQSLIATFAQHVQSWPSDIGNGTVFMMEKFLKYRFAHFSANMHFLDRMMVDEWLRSLMRRAMLA